MDSSSSQSSLITQGILDFLSQKGKKNLLPDIYQNLGKKVIVKPQKQEIEVRSSLKLSPDVLNKIKDIVKKSIGADYPVKNVVDKSLIAGFSVKVGDWYMDATLKADLEKLKRILKS